MKIKSFTTLGIALLGILFIAGAQLSVSAQGRSRGGGGGNSGVGGGPPGGSPGVDRGLGNASGRSGGRSDDGLGTASDRSGGRSDNGLNRARARGENRDNAARGDAPRTDKDLHRFQGIAKKLDTTPDALRTQYEAARAANPNLKFGQFVAANVVANNLSATHSNITSSTILAGLQSGKSIGQTLQDLGLSSSEAKLAEKNAKNEIKHSRK
jgi:hypothetical protein